MTLRHAHEGDPESIRYLGQLCKLYLLKYLETREDGTLQSLRKTATLTFDLKSTHYVHPLARPIVDFARTIISLSSDTESSSLVAWAESLPSEKHQTRKQWLSEFW